jgi:hypothetical protein
MEVVRGWHGFSLKTWLLDTDVMSVGSGWWLRPIVAAGALPVFFSAELGRVTQEPRASGSFPRVN